MSVLIPEHKLHLDILENKVSKVAGQLQKFPPGSPKHADKVSRRLGGLRDLITQKFNQDPLLLDEVARHEVNLLQAMVDYKNAAVMHSELSVPFLEKIRQIRSSKTNAEAMPRFDELRTLHADYIQQVRNPFFHASDNIKFIAKDVDAFLARLETKARKQKEKHS